MLPVQNHTSKKITIRNIWPAVVVAVLFSCASIGTPTGGPIDETPPQVIGSTPPMGAVNNQRTKISIAFDEYIQLQSAAEKIVISPPQIMQPEISVSGKRIIVNLQDTLKPNTTYTIDFADAILDYNEKNPMGDFAFTFSTGANIDTLEVAGTVLDASNLEPVKGVLVGLHSNLSDSAFLQIPFDRVARTDSRGRFRIRGVAPGTYRIYGLVDADQNFIFSQKSEVIAFNDSLVIPHLEQRTRMDTTWLDSLTYDTIVERPYTHYLPDDIILRSFKEFRYSQYLIKSERLVPNKFSLYFSEPAEELPQLIGLNFNHENAFVIEHSIGNDTIHYWVKDSLLYKQDTLAVSIKYLYTDTLNKLVPQTDTLRLVSKQKYKKMMEAKQEQGKEQKKKKGKKDDDEETKETEFLSINPKIPVVVEVYGTIPITFNEPVVWYDSKAIHLKQKVDTIWYDVDFEFEQDTLSFMNFTLFHDWEPACEYELSIDSLAFRGIYGLYTDKVTPKNFKVRSEDEYFTLHFNVMGIGPQAFIEIVDVQDKVIRRRRVDNGIADFYFMTPGKYSARIIEDNNGNGEWDTGEYATKQQPEMVYYYPDILDIKALWDVTQTWDVKAVPLDQQKHDDLKQQKPDDEKKKTTNRSK